MLEIYLEKLELDNFRDISGVFTLNQKTNEFRGQNGTGKTSLYDAEKWLKEGKNSLGQTKFDIKPIRDGKPVSKIETSVKGHYMVNGVPLILERIYMEDWTKTRGNLVAEKKGHKTVYRIDESAKTKKKDFDKKVQEVFGGEEYLLCTDASYFVGLHWTKKRERLSSMVGKLDLNAVIDSIPGFREWLAGKTPDERKAIMSERKTAINGELGKIPDLIAEHKRIISSASKGSMSILHGQVEVEKAEEAVRIAQGKIANFEKANSKKNVEGLKNLYKQLRESVSAYEKVLEDCRLKVTENNRQKTKTDGNLKELAEDIVSNKLRIKSLLDEFQIEKDSTYEHSGNSCKCCGEVFVCQSCNEDKEKQEKLFNQGKSETFKKINETGVGLEDKNKDLKTLIKDLETQKTELEKFTPDPCLEIEESKETLDIKAQIQTLEEEADQEKEEVPEAFNEELKDTQNLLTQVQEDLAGLKATDESAKRVQELEGQRTKFSEEFNKIEQFLFLYDQYTQKVAEQTEGPISALFGYVNFRMFNTQENGAVVPACDILNDEMKPYETAMSNGEKVRAQLDILNTFQSYFKMYGPVFIENCESVTRPQQLDCQMIKLVHDEDVKKLTQA